MERLDLTGNGMGDEGGVALAKVIRDNEYITEFVYTVIALITFTFKNTNVSECYLRVQ